MKEVPYEIADAMAAMEPFKSACEDYGYDWDRAIEDAPAFDYTSIDPFRGRECFDNGEPIGPSLAKVYLDEVPGAAARLLDPGKTLGDSFGNPLRRGGRGVPQSRLRRGDRRRT